MTYFSIIVKALQGSQVIEATIFGLGWEQIRVVNLENLAARVAEVGNFLQASTSGHHVSRSVVYLGQP